MSLFLFLLSLLLFFSSTLQATTILGTGTATFWPFLQQAYNSYKLIEPSFEIKYEVAPSLQAGVNRVGNRTHDFAMIDSSKINNTFYKAQMFPWVINTIVPQVNFNFSTPVILPRSAWAEIFMGKITMWNDPAIQAVNTRIMPNSSIKVFYRSDSTNAHFLLSNAFSKFSQGWKDTYGILGLKYPTNLTKLPQFHGYDFSIPLNGAVASNYDSISYVSYYLVSRDPSLQYARLIHKYTGEAMQCNGSSLEAAGETLLLNNELQADYSLDSPVSNAWPIGSFLNMMISTQPKDCDKARALFKFIRWTLSSLSSRESLRQVGFGPTPWNVTNLVIKRLSQIQCEDGTLLGAYTDLYFSNWIEVLFFSISVILLLLGIVLAAIHIYFFSTTSINIIYSVVFVIGTIFTLASPLFWFFPPVNSHICLSRVWTASLGFSILLATMFSRTWQLNDIYQLQKHGKSMDALRYKAKTNKTLVQLGMTLGGAFLVNIIILALWSGLDPFTPRWVMTDDITLSGYYTCSSNHSLTWLILELVFFLFLLCFGIYVIYNTWSFQRQALLVETRYVLFALYNVVLNIVAIVPLLAFVNITERVLALVAIISLDLSGASIICAVLLPRLLNKLELSRSGPKDGSSGIKGTRLPTGTGTSKQKKQKVDLSRTPEDELAKRLEEPYPLQQIRNAIIGKDGMVKIDDHPLELCTTPKQYTETLELAEISSSNNNFRDRSVQQSPDRRGMSILEESHDGAVGDLEESYRPNTPPLKKASPLRYPRHIPDPPKVGSFDSESGLLHSLQEG